MRLGRLSATKGTNNGFGSPSIEIPVRLWECISVIVLALVLEHSGNLCHPSIVSARSVTAISGRLTKRCCLASVTERLAKIVVKPITLSGLTAHCGSESQGWYARPYPSPKSSKITLAQSGISFITTMHPYGFRTTGSANSERLINRLNDDVMYPRGPYLRRAK